MKRLLGFVLLFSFGFLFACSSGSVNGEVVIDQQTKDDVQFNVMDLLADQFGMWDITINDKTASEIEVTVDHYVNGEKQEPIIQMSTVLDDSNKSRKLNLVIAEQVHNDESKWIAAFIEEDGLTSGETFAPSIDEFHSKTYSSISVPFTGEVGETIMLYSILVSDSEEPIATHTIYEDEIEEPQLENYDHAYIMTLKVK